MGCHGGVGGGWVLALLAPLLVAGLIVVLAPRLSRWRGLERFESALGESIASWHRARTIALFADLSALGSSTLVASIALAAAVLFALRGERQAALATLLAPSIAGTLGSLLKRLTRRARPNEPAGAYFGSSLPSNHTLMASALYGTLALELVERLPAGDALRAAVFAIALLVIAAVGAARVLLRVHHPSDVVAAWALGAAIVGAVAMQPWQC